MEHCLVSDGRPVCDWNSVWSCHATGATVLAPFLFSLGSETQEHGSVTTSKPHQQSCVYDYEGTLNQFKNTFHTHAKNDINALKILSLKTLQKEARSFFRPSEKKQQKGTNRMKEGPRPVKAQNVPTVTKFEGLRQIGLNAKGLVAHLPSSFCDTETLRPAPNQLPGLMQFLAQHVQGPSGNLMPPSQAPSPPRGERPCHQAHTTR